jgi:hypothetical protein
MSENNLSKCHNLSIANKNQAEIRQTHSCKQLLYSLKFYIKQTWNNVRLNIVILPAALATPSNYLTPNFNVLINFKVNFLHPLNEFFAKLHFNMKPDITCFGDCAMCPPPESLRDTTLNHCIFNLQNTLIYIKKCTRKKRMLSMLVTKQYEADIWG